MAVKFVDGDVFETEPNVALAHGCNCAGAMGKGIAVEFKRRWPAMYACYKAKCNAGELTCGDVHAWKDDATGRIIFNLGTQKTWRTKATFDAIRASLEKTVILAEELGITIICMPLIGAGLGGLDARTVRQLITEVVGKSGIMFVVCENFSAGIAPLVGESY